MKVIEPPSGDILALSVAWPAPTRVSARFVFHVSLFWRGLCFVFHLSGLLETLCFGRVSCFTWAVYCSNAKR